MTKNHQCNLQGIILLLVLGFYQTTAYAQLSSYAGTTIQRVGQESITKTTSSSSRYLDLPSNIEPGDITLICLGQSDATDLAIKDDVGWTRLGVDMDYSDERDVNIDIYYKIYQNGDQQRIRVRGTRNNFAYLITLRGVDNNAPFRDEWGKQFTDNGNGGACPNGGTVGRARTSSISSSNQGMHFVACMFDDPITGQTYSSRDYNNEVMNVRTRTPNGDDALFVAFESTNGSATSTRYLRNRSGNCLSPGAGDDAILAFTLRPGATMPPSPTNSVLIDDCENASDSGWTSSNAIINNSSIRKVGNASVRSRGSQTDDFRRVFGPINANANNTLKFWYYVDNRQNMSSSDQVELGSGGQADTEEYNWTISRGIIQEDGWVEIELPFSEAGTTGGAPDISRLNWFRLYRVKTGEVTSRIDDIRLVYRTPTSNRTMPSGTTNQASVLNVGNKVDNFRLFPNPANRQFKILLNNTDDPVMVRVVDLQGRLVLQEESNELVRTFDVSNLENGLYLVNMTNKAGTKTVRLVIQN